MQIKHLVISTLFIPLPLLSMESQFDAKLKKNLLSTYKAFQAISPNKECPQAPKPQTALNSTIIPSDNQADNSYETQEPTQRTKEFVQRALHSFNIPSDSIKISAFKYNVKNVAGNANPNQIKINEKWHGWNSDDTLTYLCFHEAGHVRDKANLKVVATIVAGQFATFAASGIAGFFITLKLIDMAPLELILKIPAVIELSLPFIAATGAGSLAAQQLTWYITKYANAQAEHRANELACKKLIELDELKPIMDRLSGLRASFNNSSYRQPYGPTAKEEYQHIKNVLKENGYHVVKKPFPTYQNYAGCLQITKDGHVKAESATCAYLR